MRVNFFSFFLTLVLFFSSINTFSITQKELIDSLLLELTNAKDDTTKIDILNEIAWKISRSYPDSSLKFAEEAYVFSEEINYDIGIALSNKTKASIYRNQGNYSLSKETYKLSLEIYEEIAKSKQNYYSILGQKGIANMYNGIGLVEWRQGKYIEALDNFFKSIEIFNILDDSLGIANCYNNIGLIHWNQENLDRSIEYFKKAQEVYAGIDHKNGMGNCFNNIGIVYKNQGNYTKAIEFYKKSLEIYTELNDKKGMSSVNNNIGILYRVTGNYNLSLKYNKIGLALYKERNDKYGIAMAYGNYANLYQEIADTLNEKEAFEKYQLAVDYSLMELEIAKEIEALSRISDAYSHLANAYEGLKNYKKAFEYQKEYINIKDSAFTIEKNKQIEEAEARFKTAEKEQEIEKQKLDLKRQKTIRNSFIIFSLLIVILAILVFSRFLLKRKVNRILEDKNSELQKINLELSKLSIVARETDNAVIIMDPNGNFEWINEGFTKMYGYTFEELLNNRGDNIIHASENPNIKKLIENLAITHNPIHYEALSENKSGEKIWVQTMFNPVLNKNNEVEKIVVIDSDITELKKAEEKVLTWKEGITDSISYAKRIQEALLPSEKGLKKHFDETFILYKPKAIVSGDFYWYAEIDDKIIVVASDCTGHGVPGAFMSLIGISFLNRIVKEQRIIHPDIILNKLHEFIINSLHKPDNQGHSNDGMDLSIVLIDPVKKEIEYTGAMNSIYIISNDELKEYKADIIAIGELYMPKNFTNKLIKYNSGDIIYLFSDGFADQYGGPKNTKLKYHQFKKKLFEIREKPLANQKEILWNYFANWQGNNEQIDDILVMGLKL
jgi:PAS domain S-box-containing protein